jgi:hypothetical protein
MAKAVLAEVAGDALEYLRLQPEITDVADWDMLQADVAVHVANAPLFAFQDQCYRLGEMVRLGVLPRARAADILQTAAHYNSLPFEYGRDRVQALMAEGIGT